MSLPFSIRDQVAASRSVPGRGWTSPIRWAGLLFAIALSAVLSGCAPAANSEGLPVEVESAPRVVREAYGFAAAHPEVLTQLPCYCGCGAMGHTSNYACYISEVASDGSITYDLHAVGCSICVDITRDTMRMLDEGRSVAEIRTEIDATYSAFGPSNMP